jgi:RHS repeat-associated protein
MIEAAGGYAGTYYYHYDALGSVVALSDADGDTVQVYEYDVYGQVAASDANHPNPFLFTGRRFDTETGLYYYRARYYNASIGRFLQTDPIGYEGGTNWYMYCTNNPWNALDPFGLEPVKVDDREGYIYDLWARPAGHPALERGQGPYYSQTYRMSCVPTAILNWWLTYNVDLSAKAGRKIVTDLQAEEYVMGLLTHEGRFHDWNTEGVKNMMMIESVMIGVVDKSGVMEGVPQAGTIVANVVKHDKAMMVAVDMSMGAGTGWHCIMIAPTPQDYIEDWIQGYGYDPGPISVIGLGYEHPQMYSESDFATWWEWMLKNNLVADAYYVGPDVPEGNGSAE